MSQLGGPLKSDLPKPVFLPTPAGEWQPYTRASYPGFVLSAWSRCCDLGETAQPTGEVEVAPGTQAVSLGVLLDTWLHLDHPFSEG